MDCIRRVHGVETLSEREIDVLKLLAQGKRNKEIGSALFISEGTVKSHVKSIFAKMNVFSIRSHDTHVGVPRNGESSLILTQE